ncbi:MAG TPA: 5-oxoprolinase subunit PxpA [Polyangiaceae bacterium]
MLLDIDLGELPDEPEALYACAHLANVACGGHAGDDASMRRAVALCIANGTLVGAHPSYPDRAGFGRQAMQMAPADLRVSVAEQCARLRDVAREAGVALGYVKAHGALYHAARADADVARALLGGAIDALGSAVTIVGPPAGELLGAATRAGVRYAREGFADRATRPDGTLVPRGEPGALVTDPAAAARRAIELAAAGGFDAICCHGDTPGAVTIARAVREALDALGGGERRPR